MRLVRIVSAWMVMTAMAASAAAGDLQRSIAKAVAHQEQAAKPAAPGQQPMPKAYLLSGAALFATGMALAMNGFLNNSNGEFPEPGEADSTNVAMGAAGLATAVGGGMLLLLGKKHVSRLSSVGVGPKSVRALVRVTW